MTTGWALSLVSLALLVGVVAMGLGLGHLDRRIERLEREREAGPC